MAILPKPPKTVSVSRTNSVKTPQFALGLLVAGSIAIFLSVRHFGAPYFKERKLRMSEQEIKTMLGELDNPEVTKDKQI